jgi:hypothetical protein
MCSCTCAHLQDEQHDREEKSDRGERHGTGGKVGGNLSESLRASQIANFACQVTGTCDETPLPFVCAWPGCAWMLACMYRVPCLLTFAGTCDESGSQCMLLLPLVLQAGQGAVSESRRHCDCEGCQTPKRKQSQWHDITPGYTNSRCSYWDVMHGKYVCHACLERHIRQYKPAQATANEHRPGVSCHTMAHVSIMRQSHVSRLSVHDECSRSV